MKRPVVIVDPRSSGVELAPTLRARGIPAIAVLVDPGEKRLGYGNEIQTSDFVEVIPSQSGLVEVLRKFDPLAIIPGAESGVPTAHALALDLTPEFANASKPSVNSLHKAQMQTALSEAGIPSLKTLNSYSETEVENWLRDCGLRESPLVVKPPLSAGSDKVFHIPARGDWRRAFREILREVSKISGKKSESAVVQEQAIGTEFAVGTVSAKGKHYLAHLIRYNKIAVNGRETVYDHVEFIPFDENAHTELFDYCQRVLDALGVRWGAAHTEIILTANGPRLIESVPRMCGGPVVRFAREATGSSQADRWVEIFADGDVRTKDYVLKKPVVPVFLRSPDHGIISNAVALEKISNLPTLFEQFIWIRDGDHVVQTVDYLTSIGIIGLSGDREAIFADYKKIREMESRLVIRKP